MRKSSLLLNRAMRLTLEWSWIWVQIRKMKLQMGHWNQIQTQNLLPLSSQNEFHGRGICRRVAWLNWSVHVKLQSKSWAEGYLSHEIRYHIKVITKANFLDLDLNIWKISSKTYLEAKNLYFHCNHSMLTFPRSLSSSREFWINIIQQTLNAHFFRIRSDAYSTNFRCSFFHLES